MSSSHMPYGAGVWTGAAPVKAVGSTSSRFVYSETAAQPTSKATQQSSYHIILLHLCFQSRLDDKLIVLLFLNGHFYNAILFVGLHTDELKHAFVAKKWPSVY